MVEPSSIFLQLYRFTLTIGVGLLIDLAIAQSLLWLGMQIEYAAALGFIAGATFNFVFLSRWVFQSSLKATIYRQLSRYIGSLTLVLLVRFLSVLILSRNLPDNTYPILILIAGVAVSFFANYFATRYWVFGSHDSMKKG